MSDVQVRSVVWTMGQKRLDVTIRDTKPGFEAMRAIRYTWQQSPKQEESIPRKWEELCLGEVDYQHGEIHAARSRGGLNALKGILR